MAPFFVMETANQSVSRLCWVRYSFPPSFPSLFTFSMAAYELCKPQGIYILLPAQCPSSTLFLHPKHKFSLFEGHIYSYAYLSAPKLFYRSFFRGITHAHFFYMPQQFEILFANNIHMPRNILKTLSNAEPMKSRILSYFSHNPSVAVGS